MICRIQTAIIQLCGLSHMFLLQSLKSNCRQRLEKHEKHSKHGTKKSDTKLQETLQRYYGAASIQQCPFMCVSPFTYKEQELSMATGGRVSSTAISTIAFYQIQEKAAPEHPGAGQAAPQWLCAGIPHKHASSTAEATALWPGAPGLRARGGPRGRTSTRLCGAPYPSPISPSQPQCITWCLIISRGQRKATTWQ